MKLPVIVTELAVVYHEDAFDENRVKYWLHEINLYRSDLSDRTISGRHRLEDIDARILQVLEAEPWSSARTIAEFFKIPASKVHFHLTTSLNMKNRHFKWVPYFLDDDLRAKRLAIPDSFSTSCRHKRDVIFEIQSQEMRHGSTLTGSQGLIGFRLMQNYQSASKGQLQVKSAC
jgi:hypothetical protein